LRGLNVTKELILECTQANYGCCFSLLKRDQLRLAECGIVRWRRVFLTLNAAAGKRLRTISALHHNRALFWFGIVLAIL